MVHRDSKENNVNDVTAKPEYYVFDTRTNAVFKFRRMNKYILLQTIPASALIKVSIEDFDEFFEGTPEPIPPLLVRLK